MHSSVMIFVQDSVKPLHATGKDVIEVGAMDVNGSIRPIVERLHPRSYLATDMVAGKGVDLVCVASDLPPASADLILSFEMLEHAENWRSAIMGMYLALRVSGFLFLTTRSPGFPYHGYPHDFNRFTVDDMRLIMDAIGMETLTCDPDADIGAPGVFVIAKKVTKKPDIAALAAINVSSPIDAPPFQSTASKGLGVIFLGYLWLHLR